MSSQTHATSATFVVLSGECANEKVRSALAAAATALGHTAAPLFFSVKELSARDVGLLVHREDPWVVVVLDEVSLDTVKEAFFDELQELAPDYPSHARGYRFVYVPGFEDCFDDVKRKRVAWERLKAAQHPGAPF